jgi:hypothetical protein
LARIGWIAGALEVGKILYPVLKPVVVPLITDLAGRVARSGLMRRDRLR